MSNIFGNNDQTPGQSEQGTANAPAPQNNNPLADLLGSIRNERGEQKYRDVETALKALKDSQDYISKLQQERESIVSEFEAVKSRVQEIDSVKAALEQLTSAKQQPQQTTAPVVDEKSIAEIVNRSLTAREAEVAQKTNITKVATAFQQKFGDDAEKVFYTQAEEMGMSREQINSLAAQSPSAVFKLFGLENNAVQKQQTASPFKTELNTADFQQKPETFLGRNTKPTVVGATSEDLRAESENAKRLVEELHGQGVTTYDLTDPKVYFKFFK